MLGVYIRSGMRLSRRVGRTGLTIVSRNISIPLSLMDSRVFMAPRFDARPAIVAFNVLSSFLLWQVGCLDACPTIVPLNILSTTLRRPRSRAPSCFILSIQRFIILVLVHCALPFIPFS